MKYLPISVKMRGQSIVTKIGDRGYTYSYSGEKLSKGDLRLEVVGTMDELCSFLGMAKSLVKDKQGKSILQKIQEDLFTIGGQIFGLNSGIEFQEQIPTTENRLKVIAVLLPGVWNAER